MVDPSKLKPKIIGAWLNNKNSQQVIWLYFGMIAGTILGVFNSVLTARWLGPSQFGDFRYVTNVFMLVSSLLQMGVYVSGSRLIASEKDIEKFKSIYGALIIISFLLSIFFSICIILFGLIQKTTEQSHLSIYFFYISPLLFGYQFKTLFENTLMGNNNIKLLSLLQFLPSLFFLTTFFLLGSFYRLSTLSALFIQTGGICLTILIFLYSLRKNYSFRFVTGAFKTLYIQNKTYGLQVYIGSVFGVAGQYLSGLFLSFYNSNNINVGYYTLAVTISAPLTFVASSIGSVYYKQFVSLNSIPQKVLKATFFLAIAVFLVYSFAIAYVVTLLYSKEYFPVANFAIFLALGNIIHGFGDVFNRFLGAKGKGAFLRNAAILTGFIFLIGNLTLVYVYNTNGAVATKLLSDLGYFLGILFYYIKYQKEKAVKI
jgi:O-antigen/teichoic acid export membrane protein